MTLLLSFYGDDFTGSSAVMEVLEFAGIPTVMFLDPPGPADLSRFPGARAVGIAGTARARDPAWMDRELPRAFAALAALGAPILHYKVCSTFDSSPATGSIGRATEIGLRATADGWCPVVVGAPAFGRWTAFGTLFAAAGGVAHRLDRHPVMARHPVTPMDEADLRRHLSRQTDLPVGLVDFAAMKAGRADAVLAAERAAGRRAIFLDVIDEETLAEAGRLVAMHRGLVVGSQGVQYALVAHWRRTGALSPEAPMRAVAPARPLLAVCGSCSPLTAAQIEAAVASGFATLPVDAALAADPEAWEREVARVAAAAVGHLIRGRDTIAFTARGPDGPEVAAFRAACAASGTDPGVANERVGRGLGQVVAQARRETGLARVAVAGGDTSGHALTALGLTALTAVAPLATGAPLCRGYARDPAIDGIELTLKGGQMGGADFFLRARG